MKILIIYWIIAFLYESISLIISAVKFKKKDGSRELIKIVNDMYEYFMVHGIIIPLIIIMCISFIISSPLIMIYSILSKIKKIFSSTKNKLEKHVKEKMKQDIMLKKDPIESNNKTMETFHKKIEELVNNEQGCPIPLSIIPNNMGINLSSVDSISWQKQNDGQLTQVTIYFIPSVNGES